MENELALLAIVAESDSFVARGERDSVVIDRHFDVSRVSQSRAAAGGEGREAFP